MDFVGLFYCVPAVNQAGWVVAQAFAAFKTGGSPEGLQKLLMENVLLLLKEAPGSQQLLSLQAHILLRLGR